MAIAARKMDEKNTYGDYLDWDDEERWELIDGVAYNMSPAPLRIHQKISRDLEGQLINYLKDKPCEVYDAPFDVRLPEADEDDNDIVDVVQPDLVVICDEKKLDERGCRGAPDIVVEILSASTASKDMKEKFSLYEKHGVKEYWIVHPLEKLISVFKPGEDGQYGRPDVYSREDKITTPLLEGLEVDLELVFE